MLAISGRFYVTTDFGESWIAVKQPQLDKQLCDESSLPYEIAFVSRQAQDL